MGFASKCSIFKLLEGVVKILKLKFFDKWLISLDYYTYCFQLSCLQIYKTFLHYLKIRFHKCRYSIISYKVLSFLFFFWVDCNIYGAFFSFLWYWHPITTIIYGIIYFITVSSFSINIYEINGTLYLWLSMDTLELQVTVSRGINKGIA